MRTGLTEQQLNLLYADWKEVSWLFEVDVGNTGSVDYYWSTKAKTYGGQAYTFKIIDFSPIQILKGNPELGMLPSNRTTIQVSFKDNIIGAYHASDFEGASVTIKLVVKSSLGITEQAGDVIEFDDTTIVTDLPGEEEVEIMSWCFKVKSSTATYQKMTWDCVDWFSEYLEGDYPNTPLVADLFPADIMKDDSYCVPLVFGTAYFPLRWIYTASNDYYLLGPSAPTYTIDRCRSPIESNSKTEYLSSTYTFTQSNQTGSDSNTYKCVKAIIQDSDNNGTNDANGFWGVLGKEVYDVPFKFSRSDLSTMTNPANIIEYILEDMGVPSAKIDATAQTTAAAVFTARGFSLNIPLWYKMPREKVLCKILAMSGMVLLVRDKIYMKVLTKTSQLAIEKDLVLKGTFRVSKAYTEKRKDSGYVIWQKATEPVGQGQENKSIISAKSGTSYPSDTTIECEWVSDDTGVLQQKAGKLVLQRILLIDKSVNYSAKGKILILEPGDVTTINPADYGTEGSGYAIQIEKMIIHRGLRVDMECVRFSDSLDDWGDLSASTITVGTATTTNAYRPIMQGGRDALATAGQRPNDITNDVYIASGGVLATNDDPATNGGFKATNSEITCYNTSGAIRFQAIYSGANQGDVTIGDYDNNAGVMWDQSAGTFDIRGALNADDITAGIITSRTLQTGGTKLTAATTGGDSTVYAADTSDFPSSGTAWIYDTTVDEFTYTGKTATTFTGCSGVLAHSTGLAVAGEFQNIIISSEVNEMHFYGRGTTNPSDPIIRLATIGITNDGADYIIGDFGSSSSSRTAVRGRSTGNVAINGECSNGVGVGGSSTSSSGVYGISTNQYGIRGLSTNSYGGYFRGDSKAPIFLYPSSSSSAPSHNAEVGALWVTSAGVLYINVGSSTWQKVGAQ